MSLVLTVIDASTFTVSLQMQWPMGSVSDFGVRDLYMYAADKVVLVAELVAWAWWLALPLAFTSAQHFQVHHEYAQLMSSNEAMQGSMLVCPVKGKLSS